MNETLNLNDAAQQYYDVTRSGLVWIVGLVTAAGVSLFFGAWLVVGLFGAAAILFGIISLACLIGALMLLRGVDGAQRMRRLEAEYKAWRYQAESEAIADRAAQPVQVTASGRARVMVTANSPTISNSNNNSNQQTNVVESVRIVPFHAPQNVRLVDGVNEDDLAAFIDRVYLLGSHSQRSLMGFKLPSGGVIETFEDYDRFVSILCKSGIIVERQQRSSGRRTAATAIEAKQKLGLLPSGEVLKVSQPQPNVIDG